MIGSAPSPLSIPVLDVAATKCPNCGTVISEALRNCPTCTTDCGAPNVRECSSDSEQTGLRARFAAAAADAAARKTDPEFALFVEAAKARSGVVVAVPAQLARRLVEDPTALYAGYEALVGVARKPASPEFDRERMSVSGIMFGSYGAHIVYGTLSLSTRGLPTYGTVFLRLRDIAIRSRVSFLDENTYSFIRSYGITPGTPIPPGHRAFWENRHELAGVKHGHEAFSGQSPSDWEKMLVVSDGANRSNDRFIEAHIFDGFDSNAIESISSVAPAAFRSRADRVDAEIALEAWSRRI